VEGSTVTDEMAEAVQIYLDTIQEIYGDGHSKLLFVEQRFDLSWLFPGMFGTNDCCVIDVATRTLYVLDYKHGAGVPVEVETNAQLLYYGLGALHDAPCEIRKVVIIVVQPRAPHGDGPVRQADMLSNSLRAWGTDVLLPAAMATQKEGAPLHAGKHCRFCKVLATCGEAARDVQEKAGCAFGGTPVNPQSLSPEELSIRLHAAEIIGAWSKAVQAHAQHVAETGGAIPGFKLVPKRSIRKWVNEAQALDVLTGTLGEEAYAPRKLKSVAQAEKACKKAGVALNEALWDKPDNGFNLVPVSDARREAAAPVDQAFDVIDDSLDFLT